MSDFVDQLRKSSSRDGFSTKLRGHGLVAVLPAANVAGLIQGQGCLCKDKRVRKRPVYSGIPTPDADDDKATRGSPQPCDSRL